MRNMIKKVIVPALVIAVLFAVLRPLCIQDGKCNYLLLLLLMGIPFGIGKMCVWMVPRGFDLGGTLAVWTMNFLIGGLIGRIIVFCAVKIANREKETETRKGDRIDDQTRKFNLSEAVSL